MPTYSFLIVGTHHVHMDSLKAAWKKQAAVQIVPCEDVDRAMLGEFDLVIVDGSVGEQMLPLTEKLVGRYPNTPVIVLTLSPEWRTAREILLAGAADYAQWPGTDNAAALISLIEKRITSLREGGA